VNDPVHDLRDFLSHMGIAAEVRLDTASNNPLILIEKEQFHQRRAWIEAWFILIEESGNYCSFYERSRGTGDTK